MMPSNVGWFGKLPSSADFVRGPLHGELLVQLDEWLARAMAEWQRNPRWKLRYDAMPPIRFAVASTQHRQGVVGLLMASRDSAGRRYPFVALQVLPLASPRVAWQDLPLELAPHWATLGDAMDRAMQNAAPPTVPATTSDLLGKWLESQTMASLSRRIGSNCLPQMVMALGTVLASLPAGRSSAWQRSVMLPLPSDPATQMLAAAFWLGLAGPFVGEGELAILCAGTGTDAVLALGGAGLDPGALLGMVDPDARAEHCASLLNPAWVEPAQGSGLLASCLAQPDLPLSSVAPLFLQTFLTR